MQFYLNYYNVNFEKGKKNTKIQNDNSKSINAKKYKIEEKRNYLRHYDTSHLHIISPSH